MDFVHFFKCSCLVWYCRQRSWICYKYIGLRSMAKRDVVRTSEVRAEDDLRLRLEWLGRLENVDRLGKTFGECGKAKNLERFGTEKNLQMIWQEQKRRTSKSGPKIWVGCLHGRCLQWFAGGPASTNPLPWPGAMESPKVSGRSVGISLQVETL